MLNELRLNCFGRQNSDRRADYRSIAVPAIGVDSRLKKGWIGAALGDGCGTCRAKLSPVALDSEYVFVIMDRREISVRSIDLSNCQLWPGRDSLSNGKRTGSLIRQALVAWQCQWRNWQTTDVVWIYIQTRSVALLPGDLALADSADGVAWGGDFHD